MNRANMDCLVNHGGTPCSCPGFNGNPSTMTPDKQGGMDLEKAREIERGNLAADPSKWSCQCDMIRAQSFLEGHKQGRESRDAEIARLTELIHRDGKHDWMGQALALEADLAKMREQVKGLTQMLEAMQMKRGKSYTLALVASLPEIKALVEAARGIRKYHAFVPDAAAFMKFESALDAFPAQDSGKEKS